MTLWKSLQSFHSSRMAMDSRSSEWMKDPRLDSSEDSQLEYL